MGCGSSTQVGATDNPTPTDELDENGSNSGTNPVDGQVVDVEGESNGNLLDKSPLPPIKAGDKDNPHPTDETTTDGVLRPKTSNPNHRSPRRLPKLTGPIGSLPQVEDMNEDSSEEVDTTERGVGTNSNIDSASIRSLNTLNPEKDTEGKEDDDLDVVATPAISAKGSKTSVRSAQPTPVPPSSKDGSTLSLKAEGEAEEGTAEEKPSRKSSLHSTKKSTLSLRKNSSHSLLKSSTSSRRASSTSKNEQSEHPDESVEAPEVGNSSRRGSSEEKDDDPTPPADDPANSGTEEEGTPPEPEGSENGEEPADDPTDSGTEVEGTPPEQEGSQNGEEPEESAEHDENEAIEKAEEQNEPEDEGIHEESEDKPADGDKIATELADAPPEIDNETPMTANDLGTADPSRSNSAVQVS
ncbi:cell surface glycoprotein 1-like [Tigriopus californicus]|uniref:cell surface glycoprotein 1-like n=1 Tax=Tigriopus californicus TaxID=6832 RepID=UPI0027DA9282|nr:cell surface glycoprotein 1-like [Tigriopus californicus]